jgi:hypothetical protein
MISAARLALAAVIMIAAAIPAQSLYAKQAPTNWDGLVLTKSKRFDRVYLLPGADFRPYTKVMLDPTEVAFRKNWVRDYNRSSRALTQRIGDDDAQKAMDLVRTGFEKAMGDAYRAAGYQIVQTPGPDVLRLRTAVVNLAINAPDIQTAGRSRSYSSEAGQATVVIEARDSTTGAILGRALDARVAGDTYPYLRNSVTNRSDFNRLFDRWSKASIDGLADLKARSPSGAGAVANK